MIRERKQVRTNSYFKTSDNVLSKIMSSSSDTVKNKENNDKLQKKEQIPTEYNEEQTQRIIRKQDRIPGEGRKKTINDFPYTASVGQVLKDIEFPTDKYSIIEYVQEKQSTMPESNEILSILQQIEERDYDNVADIAKAARLVEG
jgi:hypothetical protein